MLIVIMMQEPPSERGKLSNSTVCNITVVFNCVISVYILDSTPAT